jgi:predicted amidophosphoribosyltransferase
MKYKQQLCIGNYFAHKLAEKYQTMQHYDAIIPMPLSRQRIRERGFNQVLELLSVLKKKPNLVIDTHSVCRIKATQPLATLNPKQRQKEIRGAFQANSLSYQRILLVDDVLRLYTLHNPTHYHDLHLMQYVVYMFKYLFKYKI